METPPIARQLTDITGLRLSGIFPEGREPSIRTLRDWTKRVVMHIFIDESGSFVRPATGRNLSCVGALVVPDGRLIVLEREFKRRHVRSPDVR